MQSYERPCQVYRIGRKLPSNHHAYHIHYNPSAASIPIAQKNHAPVLVSHIEMQITKRQEPQVINIPRM